MKKQKPILLVLITLLLSSVSYATQNQCNGDEQAPYTADFESLKRHNDAPEWFRDAKLGIYFHWGVYSVPAFINEWYPRYMHGKGSSANKHHVKNYGPINEFAYHDFVPMFKAEKFDPEKWAKLFKQAGAKFAGPVAEHHDGFAMWDTDLTPWNAMDKGPKRDIVGEMEKAIRKQDMKFIATFHHARNNLWEKSPGKWTGFYDHIKKGYPFLLEDPETAFLYGYMPREKFIKLWKDKLAEVIEKYEPDIIWFDSCLDQMPEKARYEFAANYFNQAQKTGRDAIIVRKQEDLPLEFSINDHEKGRESVINPKVWMTDDTISMGSWCYTKGMEIKSPDKVIHALIDTVSKNGVVLLNVSPLPDGTIPDVQQKVLLRLGKWLEANGQAIYSTRPWTTFGQGPTKDPEKGFSDRKAKVNYFKKLEYSVDDIRYTASKDGKTIYAITLGKPEPGKNINLNAFASKTTPLKVKKVSMLGSWAKVKFEQTDQGLVITPSKKIKEDIAVAFKIETK